MNDRVFKGRRSTSSFNDVFLLTYLHRFWAMFKVGKISHFLSLRKICFYFDFLAWMFNQSKFLISEILCSAAWVDFENNVFKTTSAQSPLKHSVYHWLVLLKCRKNLINETLLFCTLRDYEFWTPSREIKGGKAWILASITSINNLITLRGQSMSWSRVSRSE